ncbi:Peptide-N4-(N-acetyl-beta-glucosaminyl)asparagine amidase A [Datura stramonium]|uniref:Peptide-N4-(N-acetyl-beta-glucosaminyl)asparagine amidase A n=1 Tax=Datura stramonium TaxID=4076 RepID=A0ABS8WHC3_DATST|nr:Peptide-N4-(N-acetyl-beta-glucosaminyl)asparagine amidase A [Datura stramonium]
MGKPLFLQTTHPLQIAHLRIFQIVLEWNAACKEGNLIEYLGFGLVGLRFSGAALLSQGLMGLFGLLRRILREKYSDYKQNPDYSYKAFDSGADLILPISRNMPLNDGLWFEVENSTDVLSKEFKIPQNAYRAVLEIYVSFHENDEFWYSNPPNDYISANNLTDTPGNGAFREIVVSVDDVMVGAVWPFTVIYTGGVNPLLWRPSVEIGSLIFLHMILKLRHF